MANYFNIPLINPFRFVNANVDTVKDPRYNTLPFDYIPDGWNPNGFYAQKWQLNDFTKIQFDSDFDNVTFDIYDFNDDSHYLNIPCVPQTVQVKNVSWTVYEAEIVFAAWAEGMYYGVLSYTDQNDNLQQIQTSPLDVRTKHWKTLLYEYKNTFNDKGIVFDTGILFSFRVEGAVRNYLPQSLAQDYIDQDYNTYSLNDIPYDTHTNYIGLARGLPDWVIKKMNIIFTVNQVLIDGSAYNKKSGQQFEMTRPTDGVNEDGFTAIQIIPNENYNLAQYTTGTVPDDDFIVIQRSIPYYSNSANIAITGVFKVHYNLIGIAIWNRGGDSFTLKVGLTNGGNEIAQFDVTNDITSFLPIFKVFEQAANVYLTGLDGTDLDIDIDYKNYDAPQLNPVSSTGGFVPNVTYEYNEVNIGDFDRDWNAATGIGNPGTNFENCYLLNGENGTVNDAYLSRIGWDTTVPALRGTIVGNTGNQVNLSQGVLPAIGLAQFTTDIGITPGDIPTTTSNVARARAQGGYGGPLDYEMVKGGLGTVPTLGLTAPMGSGDPLDVSQEALVCARFIYKTPA